MKISKIIIKNYRSFDDKGVEIKLPDSNLPISIVGHNNSGKSNFMNAIAMCMGAQSFSKDNFTDNDFHLKNTNTPLLIEVRVDGSLKSSDAYNQIKDMPLFQLKVTKEEGFFNASHYFCDENGKPIYNPRNIRRSNSKNYTDEEKKILSEGQKQGAEQVWKWKSKLPIYFIDTAYIQNQLKINGYTLLGKVIQDVKSDFEQTTNVMKNKKGVVSTHMGKSRKEVFDNAMLYLEDHVLSTDNLESFILNIEDVIKKQLEIDGENISLKFGFPNADAFFDNLTFFITDNPTKPKFPIDQMGKGFISLFVVALFRAILNTDEGGNIFIIEEPETFLHEHFQEYFYKILCALSEKNQVLLTTHSKKFVDVFYPENIIKIKNKGYLKSEVVYKSNPTIEYPEEIDGFKISTPKDFSKYLRTLEPNLGNIIFSSKVIIVEGPDDILAYKTVLSVKINLNLNNISVVAAWGKDSLTTIVQICKRFDIPFFVIHDWDLPDDIDPNSKSEPQTEEARKVLAQDRGQWTKNNKVLEVIEKEELRHVNKRNIEEVLEIESKKKGPLSVFEKIEGKTLEQVRKEFPLLISENLLTFLEINEK